MTEKAYEPGAVKQDPVSKAVAVLTNHGTWGVMTLDHGGHYAPAGGATEVEEWQDLGVT